MSNNEVGERNKNDEEKQPLQDMDISNIIFIKNPNNELALGNLIIITPLSRILYRGKTPN